MRGAISKIDVFKYKHCREVIMRISKLFVVLLLSIFFIPFVFAISNVQHSVDGNKVSLTYQGTPPFWINMRGDTNIGQAGGYLWAKTYSNSFSYDMSFAINPSKKFYYGVKDTSWSKTDSFISSSGSPCKSKFKMAYLLIYKEDPNYSKNFARLNNARAKHENIFNIAGRGYISLDLGYPVFSIKVDSKNEKIFLNPQSDGKVYLNYEEVIKEFYKSNSDTFDFISVYTNFLIDDDVHLHFHVKNNITGLGLGLFNDQQQYGSNMLLGVNYLGNINSLYSQDRVDQYGLDRLECWNGKELVHETAHQWGAYIGRRYINGNSDGKLPLQNSLGDHWYPGLNLGYDPNGGFKYTDNGNGTYTVLGYDAFCEEKPMFGFDPGIERFSDLTLYLLGAINAEDVKPILWIDVDPYIGNIGGSTPGVIIPSIKSRNILIQDIIAENGKRICSS